MTANRTTYVAGALSRRARPAIAVQPLRREGSDTPTYALVAALASGIVPTHSRETSERRGLAIVVIAWSVFTSLTGWG